MVLSSGLASGQDEADDFFHFGLIEYELSCLPCHGIDGRGDGPTAAQLAQKPTDLTAIASRNGGVFPAERLALVVDGREIVAAHGARAMPVWGDRYRTVAPDDEGRWDIEAEAEQRIESLVRYIEYLQEE